VNIEMRKIVPHKMINVEIIITVNPKNKKNNVFRIDVNIFSTSGAKYLIISHHIATIIPRITSKHRIILKILYIFFMKRNKINTYNYSNN